MEYTMVIKINDVDLYSLVLKDVHSILLHRKIICTMISALDSEKSCKIIHHYVNSCYACMLRLDGISIWIFFFYIFNIV